MADKIKRIPLTVENAGGVERKGWPITQGVPFADGDLKKGASVRVVDASGKTLPTQSSSMATWNKDLKYVKWLLVDFQADLRANQTEQFFLEYGPGVEAVTPEVGVKVTRSDERIRVDTGALRLDFRVPTRQARPPVASFQRARDFLAGCFVKGEDGWHDLFRGGPGPHLYLVDTLGQVYDSCTAAPTPRVKVEEEGPMRVCVCVKGYYATDNGIHLCPFTLRIHLYAGKDDVRMFHTFVFDQDPEVLEFSEVGMRFPLDLGDGLRMGFGGQEKAHFAERFEEGHFLQDSDLSYRILKDGESYGQGEQTRGWATLCGRKGSAFVAVRDFWQQYPKGYRLTREGLDVQFWPSEYGKPLTCSTPYKEDCVFFGGHRGDPVTRAADRDEATFKRLVEKYPTAPLNLKSLLPQTVEDVRWIEEMVEKYAPNRPASHNDTGVENGTGAAKTHEFWMRFSADPISDEEAEALGVCVQNAVIAPADPAYMGATRAARGLHGGPDPCFAEIDGLMDGIVEKVAIEPNRLGRQWGFWRFGNMPCSHAPGAPLAYMLRYPDDPVRGLKYVGVYHNEADDPCWGVWTQFLRTGRRDFFLAASGWSQAMGDVGVCHAHPSRDVAGVIPYHNAHHFSGGLIPSHGVNTTQFLHYYLTGNRRMFEIGLEMADWGVNTQEPAGIISCRHGRGNREFSGPLICVMEAYVATWMPKYGDLARRSLNWFLKTQEKPGIFPLSVFTRGERGDEAVIEPASKPLHHGGTIYPLYYEGLRHFDSPLLRETIVAEADYILTLGGEGHYTIACALAYEITGDPVYAACCKRTVLGYRDYAASVVDMSNIALFSGNRNGYISVLKAAAVQAEDKDPAEMAKAEERLKSLIRPRPELWPTPLEEKSIGVPAGYDA